ncbi:hypothetical protein ACVWWJ_001557 [Luteibacter sp. HA06]|jgi:hypothetical protein
MTSRESELFRTAMIHALEDQAARRLKHKELEAENAKIAAEGRIYFRTIQCVMLICAVAGGAAFVVTMIQLMLA